MAGALWMEFVPTALSSPLYWGITNPIPALIFANPTGLLYVIQLRPSGRSRQHGVLAPPNSQKRQIDQGGATIEGIQMRAIKVIAMGLLAWPAAELVAFACVSAAVGFANALFLMLLMSFAGLFILRHSGGNVARFRAAGVTGIVAAT